MFAWLKRNAKNRRTTDRGNVLDVKLRASQARAWRMRIAGVALTLLFSLAVIGFALWRGSQWLLNQTIYENDAFAIERIEVQTDGVLTSQTIRQWAAAKRGQNLMALDLMAVKRNLEMQPPIAFAAVERVLPHTLRITINERDPIAQTLVSWGKAGGGMDQAIYDFDEEGYTMKPLDPRWRTAPPAPNERLPILTGIAATDVALGRQVDSPQIHAALRLLSAFAHSPMTGMVEVQQIDISTPEVLRVQTTQGALVTFSLDNFDRQLRRWRLIYDQYEKWGKAIASLDLSIANNLPVRWVAANALPPLPVHAPKPSRVKRKHV